MKRKRVLAILLAALLVFTLGACGTKEEKTQEASAKKTTAVQKTTEEKTPAEETTQPTQEDKEEKKEVMSFDENPVVVFETEFGDMEIELYPDIAPITVTNFVKLVNEGFYDGLTFYRVWDGFMIQGGDPKGDGTGGSDETIKGEFSANGVKNDLSHERGVISMARNMTSYDSASSQFFIVHADYPSLDGQYAAFGKVISGIEVVDAVVENSPIVNRNRMVLPENQIVIKRIYLK